VKVGNFSQIFQLRRDFFVVLPCDDHRRNDLEGLLSLFAFFLELRDNSLLEVSERFGYFVDLLFKRFEQRG
jgi:hypothetical protein